MSRTTTTLWMKISEISGNDMLDSKTNDTNKNVKYLDEINGVEK